MPFVNMTSLVIYDTARIGSVGMRIRLYLVRFAGEESYRCHKGGKERQAAVLVS